VQLSCPKQAIFMQAGTLAGADGTPVAGTDESGQPFERH
jgi:hypothetical protein